MQINDSIVLMKKAINGLVIFNKKIIDRLVIKKKKRRRIFDLFQLLHNYRS